MNNPDEIQLLDADRFQDLEDLAEREQETETDFDSQAIQSISAKLATTPVGAKNSSDRIEEMAADIYNRKTEEILQGTINNQQLEKFAELCGCSSEELLNNFSK